MLHSCLFFHLMSTFVSCFADLDLASCKVPDKPWILGYFVAKWVIICIMTLDLASKKVVRLMSFLSYQLLCPCLNELLCTFINQAVVSSSSISANTGRFTSTSGHCFIKPSNTLHNPYLHRNWWYTTCRSDTVMAGNEGIVYSNDRPAWTIRNSSRVRLN